LFIAQDLLTSHVYFYRTLILFNAIYWQKKVPSLPRLHMPDFFVQYLLTSRGYVLLIIYLDARLPSGLKEAIIIKKLFVRLKCWPIDRLICFVAFSPIQLFNYFIFLNPKNVRLKRDLVIIILTLQTSSHFCVCVWSNINIWTWTFCRSAIIAI